ncbi:MAG: GNAT family N-acetyltransferase [Myxococcaceae bacterium]
MSREIVQLEVKWEQGAVLRPILEGDLPSIVQHANDREVWRNMRDAFPHPYTMDSARAFFELLSKPSNDRIFGIDVGGKIVGACGVHVQKDVYARSAEIGYWLGRSFHGRGLMSKAVGVLCDYAFTHEWLARLYASVFAWNPASARVLEKNGFHREAVVRQSVFKDGQLIDAWLYARLR